MKNPLHKSRFYRIPGYFMLAALFCLAFLMACSHSRGQDDIRTGAERTGLYLPLLKGKGLAWWPTRHLSLAGST